MALDVAAEVLGQAADEAVLVDAARLEPPVLVVAPDAVAEVVGEDAVVHPLLRVPALEAHLLEAERHGLEVGLHVADEQRHEDEADEHEGDGEELLPLVVRRLQALPDGAHFCRPHHRQKRILAVRFSVE